MTAHIDLEIADFLAGRLPAARRDELESHLRQCPECARRADWARRLRDEALRDDAPHVTPERVVAISRSGPEPATDQERDHLSWCSGCRQDLEWAGSTPAGEEAAGDAAAAGASTAPAVPAARRQRSRRWIGWLGLAATAAAVVLLVVLLPPGAGDPSGLARIEPLPVRLTRTTPEPGSFEEARQEGLADYRAGHYADAREHLARASRLHPASAETRLYLGSAHMLLGEHRLAIEELARAADAAEGGIVLQESLWQLAQASLAAGDRDGAATALVRLTEEGGARGRDAAEQLTELRAR